MTSSTATVLITGAAGYVGGLVTRKLAEDRVEGASLIATDLREVPAAERLDGVTYDTLDITSDKVSEVIGRYKPDVVVHLAALVTPPKGGMARELAYEVDVVGTQKVLDACLAHGVRKVIVTSSGAAYGFHADNPVLFREDDELRGNEEFAYAHHKKLVEGVLAKYRAEHPELEQLVFRPGVVLGESVHNQITAIFERPVVVGLWGIETPFSFIWDEDVAACIAAGVHGPQTGTFNLIADGTMSLQQIAGRLHKPYLGVPIPVITGALTLMQRLGVGPYGPEQVSFLRYRPVLSNQSLKRDFGYTPRRDSSQVFDLYAASHA